MAQDRALAAEPPATARVFLSRMVHFRPACQRLFGRLTLLLIFYFKARNRVNYFFRYGSRQDQFA
jgi:hypothetical protein